jgi:hypothetical protein
MNMALQPAVAVLGVALHAAVLVRLPAITALAWS